MEAEGEMESLISSSFSRFIKLAKPHLLYVIPFIIFVILLMTGVIKARTTFNDELDVLMYWGLILGGWLVAPFITIGALQIVNGSKRIVIQGIYFNTTRGMEKGDVIDIGKLSEDKDSPEYQIYGGLGGYSQVETPGKRDFYIGPKGCFFDFGKVELFLGDPSRYDVWDLPEKLRDRFVRKYEYNGKTIYDYTIMPGYDRAVSKIMFSPIGYDPLERKWVGERVAHEMIKLEVKKSTSLRDAMDVIEKAKPKPEKQQPQTYERRYIQEGDLVT